MFDKWKQNRRLRLEQEAATSARRNQELKERNAEMERRANEFEIKISHPDFGYRYDYEETGYRINMTDRRIFLKGAGVGKIFQLADLRDIERRWITPEKATAGITTGYGGRVSVSASLSSEIATAIKNKKAKRNAKEASGLIISVADIDHPIFHIYFLDQPSLIRSYEIVHQAMEGRLPHKQHQA